MDTELETVFVDVVKFPVLVIWLAWLLLRVPFVRRRTQAYAKIASVPIEEVNVVNDRPHFASSVSVKKASFDGEARSPRAVTSSSFPPSAKPPRGRRTLTRFWFVWSWLRVALGHSGAAVPGAERRADRERGCPDRVVLQAAGAR